MCIGCDRCMKGWKKWCMMGENGEYRLFSWVFEGLDQGCFHAQGTPGI